MKELLKSLLLIVLTSLLVNPSLADQQVCVGGVCYLSVEAARAAGVSQADIDKALKEHAQPGGDDEPYALPTLGESAPAETEPTATAPSEPGRVARPARPPSEPTATVPRPTPSELGRAGAPRTPPSAPRLAMGKMSAKDLIAFLRNEASAANDLENHSLIVIFLLILFGGLMANLTPCVLPLVPVNLILVGKGWKRGAAYGAGIAFAYGLLGVGAALFGLAFGEIQSSPWFSVVVASVFTVLGLAMSGVFFIDFTKYRAKAGVAGKKGGGLRSTGGVFLLGMGSAVLAGACVEPILLATLLLTAKWYAAGKMWSIILPFILGMGMGLPWPFAAAGMSVLPKPGDWMRWVNRAFACVFFAMAAWYWYLAYVGFTAGHASTPASSAEARLEATPETWTQVYAAARQRGKPVFVDIWATWCKNCLAMEKTTFREPAVEKELARFTVIRLQAEQPKKLMALPDFKNLDIKGFPAFLIFE